jgi:hypothetical protein
MKRDQAWTSTSPVRGDLSSSQVDAYSPSAAHSHLSPSFPDETTSFRPALFVLLESERDANAGKGQSRYRRHT